jgi:nitrate reductase delta subunit
VTARDGRAAARSGDARAVAAKAASLLLRYPDETTLAALPAIRAALTELPSALARPLAVVLEHREAGDPTRLAAEYVELFDLRRRCCLYLSYYTAGDTRRRGEALLEFAAAYRESGLAVDGGELPDFLPAVLDLAASAGAPGWALLRRHRIGLDLLAQALDRDGSPYRYVVEAVRAMLPPPGAAELAAAAALARSGPPHEEVGLQPFALNPGGRR